jgi:energy-coupling factor transporter transmembrane protein EcfT
MGNRVPSFLLDRSSSAAFARGKGKMRTSFIEKSICHLADVIKTGYVQWESASRIAFLQKIDARIKVLFLLFYVVIISLKRDLISESSIGGSIFMLAVISRLDLIDLYKRVLFWAFIFGFVMAFPSAFNIINQGEIIFPVAHLPRSYSFWIYHIPEEIGLTREGIHGVLMLTLRVMNSLALSFLVLSTTSLPEIIRALKVLRVPDSFLMIITLTYKYIFIFARTVEDMFLAKKSRLAVQTSNAEARRWITGRIAFIFRKTRLRCEEIFKAMLSRGFADEIRIYKFRKLTALDWSTGICLFMIGILFLWI